MIISGNKWNNLLGFFLLVIVSDEVGLFYFYFVSSSMVIGIVYFIEKYLKEISYHSVADLFPCINSGQNSCYDKFHFCVNTAESTMNENQGLSYIYVVRLQLEEYFYSLLAAGLFKQDSESSSFLTNTNKSQVWHMHNF